MPIRVVLPVIPTTIRVQRRAVTVGRVPNNGVVGLVDNGKGMAEEILLATAAALGRGRALDHELLKKPTASRAITLEARAELLARSRLVVSGVGD